MGLALVGLFTVYLYIFIYFIIAFCLVYHLHFYILKVGFLKMVCGILIGVKK